MLKRRNKTSVGRRERGLQLVEAAFVMPIMVLLLGSVAEFGRYFHMRSTMLRATMTGAAYMADKPNLNTEYVIAKRMALCGLTTTCFPTAPAPQPLLIYSGLTESNITVTVVALPILPAEPTVTVATNNVIYAPVFSLSRMTGNANPNKWMNIPINVKTIMRYSGS
jgi:Flp pilus assembly protein TadG